MWDCRWSVSPWAKSLIHRYWGMPPMRELVERLQREVTELGESLRAAVRDFKGHMESCDKRYVRDSTLNEDRHKQNTHRLDNQDVMLRWCLAMLISLFLAVIGALFAIVSGHIKVL